MFSCIRHVGENVNIGENDFIPVEGARSTTIRQKLHLLGEPILFKCKLLKFGRADKYMRRILCSYFVFGNLFGSIC